MALYNTTIQWLSNTIHRLHNLGEFFYGHKTKLVSCRLTKRIIGPLVKTKKIEGKKHGGKKHER